MDEVGLQAGMTAPVKSARIENAEGLLERDDEELPAIRGLAVKSTEQARASVHARMSRKITKGVVIFDNARWTS